jgi:16S rRNA C1402 (ribose-2'-O) methylase RsmI
VPYKDFTGAFTGGVEQEHKEHFSDEAGVGIERQKWRMTEISGTLVFYESQFRIEKLLGELNEVFPDREVVLARELTKKFEEFLRGKPAALLEIAQKRSLKGEFMVMIAPSA